MIYQILCTSIIKKAMLEAQELQGNSGTGGLSAGFSTGNKAIIHTSIYIRETYSYLASDVTVVKYIFSYAWICFCIVEYKLISIQ